MGVGWGAEVVEEGLAAEGSAGWVAEGWEAADCRTDTPPSHLHKTRVARGNA